MASLLELSHELLHCIFAEIEPADLSSISQSCRALHSYISANRLLHKDIYVKRYDDPTGLKAEPDWEDWVHRRVKLEKLLDTDNRDAKRAGLEFVASEINSLVETARKDQEESKNVRLLADSFMTTDNIDTLLCSSSLFAPGRAGDSEQMQAATPELRQASAKLHCLYGVPVDTAPTRSAFRYNLIRHPRAGLVLAPSLCTRSQVNARSTHQFARSKVYDLREYTESTLWGPFMNDGSHRVDWEKVEAVMIVLGYNLRRFTDRSDGRFPLIWKHPFVGATPGSYKTPPRIAPVEPMDFDEDAGVIRDLALGLDAMDPYGVTGFWMRVVCFMDWNDLYAFNFSERIPEDQLREPIDTEEAIRLIRIKLQVTRIDQPGENKRSSESPSSDDDETGDEDDEDDEDWSNFEGERLPVVHFRGTSRSLHASWDPNANSKIRGTVRQTPEGEIRWTTFSIFHGEERWRSEGIQVGGLRSARGVLGNWFDKDYDMHGPAGPTAFWKESDDLDEEKSSSTPLAYF
ncbi:putative F-box domain-containing protein [Septoria linicola]|nr:putative F-box domain-containing protein [Septoria linicola]